MVIKGNGKVDLTEKLTTTTMLEILIEAIRELALEVELLKDLNAEILEKVNNLSTEGDGFSYDS